MANYDNCNSNFTISCGLGGIYFPHSILVLVELCFLSASQRKSLQKMFISSMYAPHCFSSLAEHFASLLKAQNCTELSPPFAVRRNQLSAEEEGGSRHSVVWDTGVGGGESWGLCTCVYKSSSNGHWNGGVY